MSRKALFAFVVAILLPVASYFIVKSASENAIAMPNRFYPDSVTTKIRDGKAITDTVFHQVKDIALTNQLGQNVSLSQLNGKVIVADFFFTHCPNICPALTGNIKKLQDALKLKDDTKRLDTTFVQFLSFSVDPERDSATVLKSYGDRFGVNPDVWWLLTGPKKDIYNFSIDELKLGVQDGQGVDTNFIHTQKVVLLDKNRVVRGYYNGLDSNDMSRLAQDVVYIMLEKDRHQKSEVFMELKPLLPVFAIVLIGTALAVIIISRKQRKSNP